MPDAITSGRIHIRRAGQRRGRYGARVVRGEGYILRLSRYIHLNPVFTHAAKKLPLRERIDMLRRYPADCVVIFGNHLAYEQIKCYLKCRRP